MDEPNTDSLESLNPNAALHQLKLGHQRCLDGDHVVHDRQSVFPSGGLAHRPVAVVLTCMDSRVLPEWIFDQGIGDIMSVRVAGNTAGDEIVASLELACEMIGTPLLVVMGHTRCRAVKQACSELQLDGCAAHLSTLHRAVEMTPVLEGSAQSDDGYVDSVARRHVELVMQRLREASGVIEALEQAGSLLITGAIYDVSSGGLEWLP